MRPKRVDGAPLLERFAAREPDRLGVLAEAHQPEAEVGFEAQPVEVDRHERAAHAVGDPARERGVEERHPHHEAGNVEVRAADLDRPVARDAPQEPRERDQRRERREQRERQSERARDVVAHVLGDALVGVVGVGAHRLHLAACVRADPVPEQMVGEPGPPADLERLADVDAVGRHEHEADHRAGEQADAREERRRGAVLERVVDAALRVREHEGAVHGGELERDREREQQGACARRASSSTAGSAGRSAARMRSKRAR